MFCWVNTQWRVVFYYVTLRGHVGMSHLAINAPVENSVCLAMVSNSDLPAATRTNFAMLAINR